MERSPINATPIPPSERVIHLPADHYLHPGAPTEWWWHTGTLKAGDRVFGFEINAAAFYPVGAIQVMLSDVQNQAHYQQTAINLFLSKSWAESDTSKDWNVRLQSSDKTATVTMHAPQADPTTNMTVNASALAADSKKPLKFSLTLSQEGPPMLVWGRGVFPYPPQKDGALTDNNYYYSLTRVKAAGTITLGDESFEVTGQTWMDHEYGYFGSQHDPIKWFLQAMQLDNGVHISHFHPLERTKKPQLGEALPSNATVQLPGDILYYLQDCRMTPVCRTWTSASGERFFLDFRVEIPAFGAELLVTSLLPQQNFPTPGGADIYEGVSTVAGIFDGQIVKGTAWNEQVQ